MKNPFLFLTLVCSLLFENLFAQKWVDTLYGIQQTNNVIYDTQPDFAGNLRALHMNITVPINDTPPSCGRPLLIAIHGGAFISGNKDADAPPAIMRDFAKRGFTTASINYRLGMFQTNAFVNCNVSLFGIPWNCLNMQDTSEWFRASYRGMQDAKSAIRYLIKNAALYKIDPRNVFVVGESAGGFIAMATAFLDENIEKPAQCNALAAVMPPNALYENQCIQGPGFDTSIASMNLQRPDLGSIAGNGNLSNLPYTIKGVGNFYGAIMSDLFTNYSYNQAPALYLFHQPNDLVVPYTYDRLLEGEAYCFTQFPANCAWLINRPKVYGSKGIQNMIASLNAAQIPLPNVFFDSTLNNADCLAQIGDPNVVGHSISNYWLRTSNMAKFFAPTIDTSTNCSPTNLVGYKKELNLKVYPNPMLGSELYIEADAKILSVDIQEYLGKKIFSSMGNNTRLTLSNLAHGLYFVRIQTEKGKSVVKLEIPK